MKTAIVCDWLVTVGGAEKVLGELLLCFPEADVFAVVDYLPTAQRGFLQNKSITTTFIQQLPFAQRKYRNYLPLMPKAIERLDLSAYDLIISSSHAVAKGVKTRKQQLHISYVHTPMRYAWDLQDQYLRESGLDKGAKGIVARYLLARLRKWDLRTADKVNHFIANSNYIANRIANNYQRNAHVIYPPIDTKQFTPCREKKDFYLTASRLVPYKRVDLIVESFRAMPDKKLIVIGDGPEMEKIKSKAGANVRLLGYQENAVLIEYMQNAKAFIFAADEDFGIMPVEAQACGTPVIAYGKGGALETVRGLEVANSTGVFFAEQSCAAIQDGIKEFEQNRARITMENCVNNAAMFSKERFRSEISRFVAEKIKTSSS